MSIQQFTNVCSVQFTNFGPEKGQLTSKKRSRVYEKDAKNGLNVVQI